MLEELHRRLTQMNADDGRELREILAMGKKPRWTPKLTLEDFHTLG